MKLLVWVLWWELVLGWYALLGCYWLLRIVYWDGPRGAGGSGDRPNKVAVGGSA
ncbi:hypothetical protein AB0N07_49775 [Streptomyces sp. NPDC051172]|uniref:hypothetical protein n=1 Tax=Streptomyces sp. NPDC051172 TaxID=3155796 RepID=UPI00342E63FC